MHIRGILYCKSTPCQSPWTCGGDKALFLAKLLHVRWGEDLVSGQTPCMRDVAKALFLAKPLFNILFVDKQIHIPYIYFLHDHQIFSLLARQNYNYENLILDVFINNF